ncbi:MAG: hypothetical protein Q9217_005626 [Psora testacea]
MSYFPPPGSVPGFDPVADLQPIDYAYRTLLELQDNKSATNITDLFKMARVLNHASYALLVDLSAKNRREAANARQANLDQTREFAKAIIKATLSLVEDGGADEELYDQARTIPNVVNQCNQEQSRIDQEQKEVYNILAANSRELFADVNINHAFHDLADMAIRRYPRPEDQGRRRRDLWWVLSYMNHITGDMMTVMEGECQQFLENLATLLWHSHMKNMTNRTRGQKIQLPPGLPEASNDLDRLLREGYGIDFLDCKMNDGYLSEIRQFWGKWAGSWPRLKVDFGTIWEFVAGRPFERGD